MAFCTLHSELEQRSDDRGSSVACEWTEETSQLFAVSAGRRSEISQLFGLEAARECAVMITAQHGGTAESSA